MNTQTSPPAGWYDDGSGRQRWWDGHAWGPYAEAPAAVSRPVDASTIPQTLAGMAAAAAGVIKSAASATKAAVADVGSPGKQEPSPPPAESPAAKQPWFKNRFVLLGGVLAILAIIIAVNASNEDPTAVGSAAATPTASVAATIVLPDVVGQDAESARDTLRNLGFEAEFDATDGTVLNASNWTVDAQTPAAGTEAVAGDVITLTVTKLPTKPVEPPTTLDEIHAAQFLALAWEDRFPYGGTVHWIVDRITTANADGTFTFKIGVTVKNEYGTEIKATIEGDVGGTNDAPIVLDSILYTNTGDVIDF